MKVTLEQCRAKHAWDCVQMKNEKYVNLAKGLPALIMNSGLMQTMAFLESKGADEKLISGQMRNWLVSRGHASSADFKPFMDHMFNKTGPQEFRASTAEALAWLRWVRHFAAAVNRKPDDEG